MLVEARDVEDLEEDVPVRKAPKSQLRVRSGLDEEYSSDEIEKMTLLYEGTLSNIEEGEIVKSKVLRVTDTAVILDVGFKSEGAVPIDEFKDARSLKEGDEIEVFLEHLEDQEGAVVLSKKKADFMRVWERIREAHEKDEAVSGTLVKKIKGGVVVDHHPALDLLDQGARDCLVLLVGLADPLPHPHEVGLLLREDDRAFLVLQMLEEDLDLVPFLQGLGVLELVDRHRAFRLEPDVENDGGVGHAQHLGFDDLALLNVGERPLVQLRHLGDLVGRVFLVEV